MPSLASQAKGGDPFPPREGKALTWLALEPLTGRTHQLRVHCAAMGWPIRGDAIYGTASRKGGPILHLHAREVVVPLYKNRAPIRVVAPICAYARGARAMRLATKPAARMTRYPLVQRLLDPAIRVGSRLV